VAAKGEAMTRDARRAWALAIWCAGLVALYGYGFGGAVRDGRAQAAKVYAKYHRAECLNYLPKWARKP
jgi:hypothetical protein